MHKGIPEQLKIYSLSVFDVLSLVESEPTQKSQVKKRMYCQSCP